MINKYVTDYRKLFEDSAVYNVLPINEERFTYKVYMGEGDDYQHNKSHELNIKLKKCSCGHWQDTDLTCVHLFAYYRVIENKSCKEILDMPYNPYYGYQYLNNLYKDNINPVVIDTLSSDNTTMPPPKTNKRQPGRRSNKRKQRRSFSENTVHCSNCGQKGHNKKRCPKVEGYKFLKTRGLIDTDSSDSDNDEDKKQKAKPTNKGTKRDRHDESSDSDIDEDKKPKAKPTNKGKKRARSEKSFL
jgi:hypothetical protein